MGRSNVLTISMVVLGAVLFATVAPHSNWGWNENKNVEIPTVSANWAGGGLADSPAHIIIAAPPYIILEAIPDQGRYAVRQLQLRISIQTMSGSYSDYLTSTNTDNTESNGQPVHLASSDGPGSIGGFPFVLIASD